MSRKMLNFAAKLQKISEKMNNRTNEILLRIKHYFYCLWLALIGRNPYTEDSDELWKKIEELKKLKENYCVTLDRWSEANKKVGELSQSNASLKSQVEHYRVLVENLRERIRDKERIIDEYENSPIYNKVDEKKD